MKGIERRNKITRWRRTDEEYKQSKLSFLQGKIAQVRNLLMIAGREFKFLTNLKIKYAGNKYNITLLTQVYCVGKFVLKR